MVLRVKRLTETATLPTLGDAESAGIDIYADLWEENSEVIVFPRSKAMIRSGIACEFPEGYFGLVLPRSSVGIKRNLMLSNNAGVIDNSYRGEIVMQFINTSDQDQIIKHGDRLAQMILLPYVHYDVVETEELSDTERGEGGIGSTGR